MYVCMFIITNKTKLLAVQTKKMTARTHPYSQRDVVERVVQDQSDRLHELSAYVSGTSY